jgi:uncharacterized protein (DUF1800 family)
MDSDRFALRFGFGLPAVAGPAAALSGADHAAKSWPGVQLAETGRLLRQYREARKAKDEAQIRTLRRDAETLALRGIKATIARAVGSEDPFRERLVAFWADHFTTVPKNIFEASLPGVMIDDAIRPQVTGRFADMLAEVVTHPAMLIYLNQEASFGPGSPKGRRQKKGLNENLARELLELHTLGVGAGYDQSDVRELAELLTGLAVGPEGFVFDDRRAEPGAETVLGVRYAGEGMAPIRRVLGDLAARPETAAHLARKLAVHFAADDPDPGLVAALEDTYRETDGDLAAVSRTLLDHPAALIGAKARQPFDFMVAALRALGVGPEAVLDAKPRPFRRLILEPLAAMGQPFQQAPGPDGWPEREAEWITPQGLAARIDWAMQAPERLVRPLPDPRDFLRTALGDRADQALVWAVSAAETARDGVGLVLASPAFNRR